MIVVIAYVRWMFMVFSVVHAVGFTYPNSQAGFVVGDLVNITWNVPAARFSLYELCQTAIILECAQYLYSPR